MYPIFKFTNVKKDIWNKTKNHQKLTTRAAAIVTLLFSMAASNATNFGRTVENNK
jgi:hypothetical protein